MSSNPVRDLEVAENYPMDSQAMSSNLLQLKQAMRATWMAGDFRQIARYMEREAEAFVERLGIIPGMKVLDVACGTGNVAVPAARKGAQVVGIDIAPNLLEQARQRAVAESLEATFEEREAWGRILTFVLNDRARKIATQWTSAADGVSIILNASIAASTAPSQERSVIAPQKPPCVRSRGHGQRT
jgi:SAM-dependent methyltransferase